MWQKSSYSSGDKLTILQVQEVQQEVISVYVGLMRFKLFVLYLLWYSLKVHYSCSVLQ